MLSVPEIVFRCIQLTCHTYIQLHMQLRVSGTEERKSWEQKYGFEWVTANRGTGWLLTWWYFRKHVSCIKSYQELPQPLLWFSVSLQSSACFGVLYFLCEFVLLNISEPSLGSQVSPGGAYLPGSLASSRLYKSYSKCNTGAARAMRGEKVFAWQICCDWNGK